MIIEKIVPTSKVHVEYFVRFDSNIPGILEIYSGQVWEGGGVVDESYKKPTPSFQQ